MSKVHNTQVKSPVTVLVVNIGEAIRQRRTDAKMLVRHLAAACDVDSAAITRWESNETQPRQEAIEKMEDALGLQRGQLRIDAQQVSPEAMLEGLAASSDSPRMHRLIEQIKTEMAKPK